MIADDLFAGAGGWDVAAQGLGIEARGVENMPAARATRAGNAVPPGLAHHALAAAAGLAARREEGAA